MKAFAFCLVLMLGCLVASSAQAWPRRVVQRQVVVQRGGFVRRQVIVNRIVAPRRVIVTQPLIAQPFVSPFQSQLFLGSNPIVVQQQIGVSGGCANFFAY